MAGTVNKRVNIYIDQQAAQAAYDKLISKQDMWTKKIDAGKAAGKSMVTEMKKLDDVNSTLKHLQDQMDKGLKPTITQQTQLVAQLRNELKRLSESDPQFNAKLENLKRQSAELQRMNTNVQNVTKSSEGLAGIFTKLAGLAIGAKIIGFLRDSVEEASKSQQAFSKLKNILDNVGRSDAFDRLSNKANEMAKRFKFIDNDDIVDVFQKLITYGKLTEKQIDDLTPVIINFAAKSQISLQESTDVIVRALEGNARALKEYGISIKNGATETERMAIIMDELKPRVEGAADAFGQTFAGQVAIARQKVADLKEELGNNLIPVWSTFLDLINQGVNGLKLFGQVISNTIKFRGNLDIGMLATQKQMQANVQQRINENTAGSLITRSEGMTPEQQLKFLNDLNTQVRKYAVFLDDAKFRKSAGDIEKYTNALTVATIARDKLQQTIAAAGGGVLGLGGKGEGSDTKKLDEAAKKLEDLKRQAQEFLKQLNDENFLASVPNHLQQVAIAAKKYFDTVDTLNKDFSEHLISDAEFKKGLAQAENIYKDKIHDLNNDPATVLKPEVVPQVKEDDLAESLQKLKEFYEKLKADQAAQDQAAANRKHAISEAELAGLGEISNALNAIDQQQQQMDQRHMDAIDRNIALEKSKYSKLLNTKAISNQAYQQKVAELDAQGAAQKEQIAKKEFERHKRLQLAEAAVAAAKSIMLIFSTIPKVIPGTVVPNPEFPIALATAIATNAAEIGIIEAQHYAEGGKVLQDGKINEAQNVPTQPGGDNVLAFVKRGEVILNERQQAALGGPGVFASIGVPGFGPEYQSRPYMAIDTSGISKTFTNLRYASGGIVGVTGGSVGSDPEIKQILQAILDNFQNQSAPIVNIKNTISLKQITDAQDQLSRIQANAILQ